MYHLQFHIAILAVSPSHCRLGRGYTAIRYSHSRCALPYHCIILESVRPSFNSYQLTVHPKSSLCYSIPPDTKRKRISTHIDRFKQLTGICAP